MKSSWTLVTSRTVAFQAPLSMGFPRQEWWCGFPYPLPGDIPDPGIESQSLTSPALAGRFFTTEPPGSPYMEQANDKILSRLMLEEETP